MAQIASAQSAYALWAPTYPPTAHNPLMQTEEVAILARLEGLRPGRALDVGTGSGRYLTRLRELGASLVVGLDLSAEMLARVRRGPGLVRGNAQRLPFAAGSFDLVTAALMAGDVPDLGAWVAELAGVMAPGGHLIYSDFHPLWAANGWRRTFRTVDGREVDLPYHPHAVHEHAAALQRAGLRLACCKELPLEGDDDQTHRFRRRWGNPSVVVVVHATKHR